MQAIEKIESLLSTFVAGYKTRVFQDPDDPKTYFFVVYGVNDGQIEPLRERLRQAIRETYREDFGDLCVIPSIKSLSKTSQFYPDMLPEASLPHYQTLAISNLWTADSVLWGEINETSIANDMTLTYASPSTPNGGFYGCAA